MLSLLETAGGIELLRPLIISMILTCCTIRGEVGAQLIDQNKSAWTSDSIAASTKGDSIAFKRLVTLFGTKLVGELISEERDQVVFRTNSGTIWKIDRKFVKETTDIQVSVPADSGPDLSSEWQPLQNGGWHITFASGKSVQVLSIDSTQGESLIVSVAQRRLAFPLASIIHIGRIRENAFMERAWRGAKSAALYIGGMGGLMTLLSGEGVGGVFLGVMAAPVGFLYGGLFGKNADEHDFRNMNLEQRKQTVMQLRTRE